MRKGIISLFILVFLFSCSKYKIDYADCSGCATEPLDAQLTISFSRLSEVSNPVIYVMSGFVEENNVIDTINTDSIPTYQDYVQYSVPVNHYYSVLAVYTYGADTLKAVDGAFCQKQTYYNADCDTICWRITGTELNVKLKNIPQ